MAQKGKINLDRRNQVQIYIRDSYKPIWLEFIRLIYSDKDLKEEQYRNRSGLISISIMKLIYNYVCNKNPDFSISKK